MRSIAIVPRFFRPFRVFCSSWHDRYWNIFPRHFREAVFSKRWIKPTHAKHGTSYAAYNVKPSSSLSRLACTSAGMYLARQLHYFSHIEYTTYFVYGVCITSARFTMIEVRLLIVLSRLTGRFCLAWSKTNQNCSARDSHEEECRHGIHYFRNNNQHNQQSLISKGKGEGSGKGNVSFYSGACGSCTPYLGQTWSEAQHVGCVRTGEDIAKK